MKPILYSAFALFVLLLLAYCSNTDEQYFCTEEFRTISVNVPNTNLTDYYTLRNSTNDTIRLPREPILGNFTYPILDDSYLNSLLNSQDVFTFVGIIDEEIVITETYVLMADRCHVDKVSGPAEIIL